MCSRYSRYNKLLGVLEFCSHYLHRLKEHTQLCRVLSDITAVGVSNHLKSLPAPFFTTAELPHAEHLLCYMTKHEAFSEEFSDLANSDRIAKSSALKLPKPCIKEDGNLQVDTRLRKAALSSISNHPIVQFANHLLSTLLTSSLYVSPLHSYTTTPAVFNAPIVFDSSPL